MQRQILVAVEEAFEAHLHSNEESNVWRSATVQLAWLKSRVFRKRCDRKAWLLSRQHCAPPIVPPWKDCWMAAMFPLSCFLKDLLRLVEHHMSFRSAMFWSSTGILLNDKAEDWNEIATSLLECCTTSRPLHMSPATAKNDPNFRERIAIKSSKISFRFMSLSNCRDSSLNFLISCFWLMSSKNCSFCWCFRKSQSAVPRYFVAVSPAISPFGIDIPGIL